MSRLSNNYHSYYTGCQASCQTSCQKTMEIPFLSRRALVTGASRGYGREIVLSLVKNGAKVVALGRYRTDLVLLKTVAPSIEIIVTDLHDWANTEKILENVGPIDLLVNNANEEQMKELADLEDEEIDRICSLNMKGLINVTQIIIRDMLRRNRPGSIVNISSHTPMDGLIHRTSVHSKNRYAIESFTRSVALELSTHMIRVNCVDPILAITEDDDAELARTAEMRPRMPLGRFGKVSEVVDTVLFLLSDKSSKITGACLAVEC